MGKRIKSKYAQIYEHEWNGNLGRVLSDHGAMAAIFYVYMFSNTHRNLSGLYRLPAAYVEADIGLNKDDFEAIIAQFNNLGFVEYDWISSEIFVVDMLLTQVGELASEKDKRWVSVESDLAKASSEPLKQRFRSIYQKPISTSYPQDWI